MVNDEFLNIAYRINAEFDYQKFVKAIKNSNNNIEKTKTIRILDEAVKNGSELEKVLSADTILYRARKIEDIQSLPVINSKEDFYMGYNEGDSKEPPLGNAKEGRCNSMGVAYLYVAESDYTACAEAKVENGGLISVARFKTNINLRIIDFSEDKKLISLNSIAKKLDVGVGQLITLIMLEFTKSDADYKVTQYITDYFRKAGYDGISYRSSLTGECNYVIFKSHKKYITFMDSELYFARQKQYNFFKFSADKNITKKLCLLNKKKKIKIISMIKNSRRYVN